MADPSELDASVTARVLTRTDRDDRYFTDCYQTMPLHGYTKMFERMPGHPNIEVMLETDYRKIICTGPVDAFFDPRYSPLPYRSLEFRHETFEQATVQPIGTVNYPDGYPYTRVTEFKYLMGQEHPKTSLVYEYPRAEGDPYYDMDQVVAQALSTCARLNGERHLAVGGASS